MDIFDMHCHLLPGVDDSKAKWEELPRIFSFYRACGVTGVCFTPHLYNPYVTTQVQDIRPCYERASRIAAEQGLKTALGSEVYVSEQEKVKGLPIFGKYLLIEFSTRYAPANLMDKVRSVLPLTPIIAHIERYGWLDPDSAVVDELKDMGCLIQCNGKGFGTPENGERIERFLEKGVVDIIASDSHGRLEDIRAMAGNLARNPEIIKRMGMLAQERR